MLEEKIKVLRLVVDKIPFLGDIESFHKELVGYWKDRFRGYESAKIAGPILSELSNLEKKLKTENSSEEKIKVLRLVVDKIPFLGDIESFHKELVGYWKDRFRGYESAKIAGPILSELSNLEKKLKTENSSDSENQKLCNQVQRLVEN